MKKLLLSIALLAAAQHGPLWAQQTLKVGYNESGARYKPLITAIYKEAGLVPEFVLLPLERSLRSVDNGDIDADMGRAAGSLASYPNAIETTESVLEMQLLAVVRKDFDSTKFVPTELKKYKLGYLRGGKMAEAYVKSLGVDASMANSLSSVFAMLAAGRLEVALNLSTTPVTDFPQYAGVLITLPQPLQTVKVVHVLNKKWANYLPKINAAIKTMRADGRVAKLLHEN